MKTHAPVPAAALALLALAGLFALARPAAGLAAAPPNIVFILVDDMGYGDLGCTGAEDIKTPHIDRIAAEGMQLTDFYANAPVCTPTRAGFMTGRWQQRLGIEFAFGYQVEQQVLIDGKWVPEPGFHALGLPLKAKTLANYLKELDYATGAFGKWHLGYKDVYNPVNRGFDEYFGELLGHADFYKHTYFDGTYALRDGLDPVKMEGRYFTDVVNERAAQFIAKSAGKPFFLYVPHLAVHAPFQAPDAPETPFVTKESMLTGSREIYKAMLERVDDGVGMIYAELEKAGLVENTLVVFSSDNGGERWANNQPFFHHKATLWEGGIRVPGIFSWPGKIGEGIVSDVPAGLVDVLPTLCGLLDLEKPAGVHLDGSDLSALLTGAGDFTRHQPLFWHLQKSRPIVAMRDGDYSLTADPDYELSTVNMFDESWIPQIRQGGYTNFQLFDLKNDPNQTTDLAKDQPGRVEEMKKKLMEINESVMADGVVW
jgi:arylsulfatase A